MGDQERDPDEETAKERLGGIARVSVASPRLNADNAAMIARAGLFHLSEGSRSDLFLDADPRLPWPGLELEPEIARKES